MEELNRRPGGAATVWFGDEPVFGVSANGGKWQHPTTECGRDMVPVPGGKRNGKWDCKVESRTGDREPEVGSRHKCWCCRWLRRVQKMHREGYISATDGRKGGAQVASRSPAKNMVEISIVKHQFTSERTCL
eukprot:g31703.t1